MTTKKMEHGFLPYAAELTHNPKASAVVSVLAGGAGISTLFNWVSQGIGITASAAGLVLAIVVIRKSILEHKKIQLEIDGIKRREARRTKEIQDRDDHGKTLRRDSDR